MHRGGWIVWSRWPACAALATCVSLLATPAADGAEGPARAEASAFAPVAGQDGETDAVATWRQRLIDPTDGDLDISELLAHPFAFLPVPIIITEPAVGYGGGVAALFIQPRREVGEQGWVRPDVSVVGGLATQNGTWMGFAADSRYWVDGRLKTLLGAGTGRVNLDFYGLGEGALRDVGIAYSLSVTGGVAEADWQLAEHSPWWVGLRYAYASVDPSLRDRPLFPGLVDRLRTTISMPGLILNYDSRDNLFTPTRGLYSGTSYQMSRESLGASVQFSRFDQVLMGWLALLDSVTLGLRGDYGSASGGTPFYLLPFVDMRGVQAMRYSGQAMASAQAELRWQFYKRWSAVLFGGAGRTRSGRGPITETDNVAAGGAGFRYELARRFGMHVGIDVAHSPGTNAFYIIVGSAWSRP